MKIPKSVLSIGCSIIGGLFITLATWLDIHDSIELGKELAMPDNEDEEDDEEEE